MRGGWNTKVFCEKCFWEGERRECPYGHNDYVCPLCGREAIVEFPKKPKSNYPIYDDKSDEVYKP